MNKTRASIYMEWAKTKSQAKYNLAMSGMLGYPIEELAVSLEDIQLNGPSFYGYAPLLEALARKFNVDVDCVVHATGTSMANHLVMAALLDQGDEVLIEQPAYEPLLAVAYYLNAKVKRFVRAAENDFGIRVEDIEKQVSKNTRLIVLTNLHNPSSAFVDADTLRDIGEIAGKVGARVLVDEVYLEAMFENAPRSAFHLGEQFIVTSSLTKVYGLGGLRCGWILAEPKLAKQIWRFNDLFGSVPAHPAECLSVITLANLKKIAARSKFLLAVNRQLLQEFFQQRNDLEISMPKFGTVVFPRWKCGDVEPLCNLLRQKYETSVVPGKFFEMPEHFRIGITGETEMLKKGLNLLIMALNELSK